MATRSVLVILLTVGISSCATALQCYQCMDLLPSSSACRLNFTDSDAKDCPPMYIDPACYVLSLTAEDGTVLSFSRGCHIASDCKSDCIENENEGVKVTECAECCNTDRCNTGSTGVYVFPQMSALLCLTIFSFLFNL